LVFSEGHFVFFRRVREAPEVSSIQKTTFKAKDMTFKVYESYLATVYFVEGELTYVAENSQSSGPFDMQGLSQAVTAGRLLPTTMVWSAGMAAWVEAQQVPALAGLFAPPPPIPPPSPPTPD
jgi:hypothetical protein